MAKESGVRRLYVEKREGYGVAAKNLLHEIRHDLGLEGVTGVRVLVRYDMEGVSEEAYARAKRSVFSEPPLDLVYEGSFSAAEGSRVFSVAFLPGQFDQRADAAQQCVKLLAPEEEPLIRCATTYVIEGTVTDEQLSLVKSHLINPVDSGETPEELPESLAEEYPEPEDVEILDGFTKLDAGALQEKYDSLSLAMTIRDFAHIQNYFRNEEQRDPSITEIRVLDTYWSDHCRHTTFLTELTDIDFEEGDYSKLLKDSYGRYQQAFAQLYAERDDKYVCLMDLAQMGMKKLRKEGYLQDLEESDEINACSIVVPIEVDGQTEEWLLNFKNETHNHPTEIEPFGGAATCLGGAIRDPLSGRTYVYQAMRVTGAADPRVPRSETLEGKLPQKKIVREAARGYSSYGNQIGLATGLVREVYDPGYAAKRMEIGAVLGAAPRRAVQRLSSDPGDAIILLGGRTGRDGIGGATGSSKAHSTQSTQLCGAEVQKGNPPTERKLQRLFRRPEVSSIIKKCNDFGAGGVSVAIGELADGLVVDLDKVPKKYAGLDGTELAISESQERMAVVVDPKDVEAFLAFAAEENLEATEVAVVTEEPRLVLKWRGKDVVNLSRAFLDTNGAHQETKVQVLSPKADQMEVRAADDGTGAAGSGKLEFKQSYIPGAAEAVAAGDYEQAARLVLSDLNVCSQQGLVEMFDGSIGAGSVLMPYGGVMQKAEAQAMAAKFPVGDHETDACSLMAYGFEPAISKWSPYHGAVYAIIQSLARIVAAGGNPETVRFTFQEYFKRMTEDPKRWSEPFSAMLGALDAQLGLKLPSLGGKDSMSGSFNEMDVPPTLVSFAVDVAKASGVVSPELKGSADLFFVDVPKDPETGVPDYEAAMAVYKQVYGLAQEGALLSAYEVGTAGIFAAVSKMALGTPYGASLKCAVPMEPADYFRPYPGGLVLALKRGAAAEWMQELGAWHLGMVSEASASSQPVITLEQDGAERLRMPVKDLLEIWEQPLEQVFHTKTSAHVAADPASEAGSDVPLYEKKDVYVCQHKTAKPMVFIPVFPGTNCEYDLQNAFERAGAKVQIQVFQNLSGEKIQESCREFARLIDASQIVMFPGGFSSGDEPEGSAKFFASAFRNGIIKEAVQRLLQERDGLMLGICNGFQALVKLGLVPYGQILEEQEEDSPTLTYNTIGRHISKMAYTKVVSQKSPWLQEANLGGVYAVPASHGEGRFVCSQEWAQRLIQNGQVATMYCAPEGKVFPEDERFNINGSVCAIEGITSEDGRILGKMCHNERQGSQIAKNIYGAQDMRIFESGVKYFG